MVCTTKEDELLKSYKYTQEGYPSAYYTNSCYSHVRIYSSHYS